MSKTTKRKPRKANGITAAERAQLDDRRQLQRSVRNERQVAKLSRDLGRIVEKRDRALATLADLLHARSRRLAGLSTVADVYIKAGE